MEPSQQHFVDPGAIVDCDDCEAGILLAFPQEVIDLNVGIAVVAVFHVSASAKESIRFIKKQDRATTFRRVENTAEILFCLADVLRDYGIQIDPAQVFSQAARQSLSRDKAPRPIFAGE